MKKLLLLITLISAVGMHAPTTTARTLNIRKAETPFCEGWKDGWKEGWKYVKGKYSSPPFAPFCPFPRAGADTYRDGYNRGFNAGQAKARE